MKHPFTLPTKNKAFIKGTVLITGGVTGTMASRQGTAQLIKEDTSRSKRIMIRAILALIGFAGAISIDNKTITGTALQGFLAGLTTDQIFELYKVITTQVEDPNSGGIVVTPPASKFARNILGLSCPCSGSLPSYSSQARALQPYRTLNYPGIGNTVSRGLPAFESTQNASVPQLNFA